MSHENDKESVKSSGDAHGMENGKASISKEEEAMGQGYTEEELEDIKCGIGSCKPSWLQRLATKEVYMLVYCMVGIVQGMFFTYSVSVISTIEKRFKLTSKQTGILLSGNDISQIILAIFLSYYGNFGHRPRWLGVGVLFSAASCFTAAMPHLMYGPGKDAIEVARATIATNGSSALGAKEELCHIHPNLCEDSANSESIVGPMILLFVAQFFVGISISIFFTIGVSYLDDNVNKKSYPIYYTATLLLRIMGPVLGFIIGGKCLSMWIDPSQKPNIARQDPRWLGAWWLGFLFIGFGLALSGGLLFFFPRKLPATLRRERKKMMRQVEKDKELGGNRGIEYFADLAKTKKMQSKPTLSNLLKALKRLFTNEIWVGNLFNSTVTILALSGYWDFKPKYLENQFRKSAAEANYYTGMASLFVSLVGAFISGAILRWVRPGPRFVTGYNIFITLCSAAGFVALIFIGCPKLNVIGPVGGSDIPDCSKDCGCSNRYTPVCAEDKVSLFYSPCYAGCNAVNSSAMPVVYSDCKCIGNSTLFTDTFTSSSHTGNSESMSGFGHATRGYCPEPCTAFTYYLLVQIIVKTIASTGRVGSSIVHLRSVADEDKGLALGTLTVFISLFGFIPAPIIMGAIIDSACVVWDKTCGVSGNCWLYDSDQFRVIVHLVPAILILVSVIGDIVMFRYSSRLDLYGEKEDDIELDDTDNKETKDQKAPSEVDTEETKPLYSEQNSKSGV